MRGLLTKPVAVSRKFLAVAGCWLMALTSQAQPLVGVTDGVGYPAKATSVFTYHSGLTNTLALQFDVAYDTSRLQLLEVPEGCLPDQLETCVKSRRQANGVQRVVLYSLRNPLPSSAHRAFARLRFQVLTNVRTDSGPIRATGIIAAKTDGSLQSIPQTPAGHEGYIYIQPVYRNTNGVVEFFLSSQPGTKYDIEATTNFIQWVTITNVTAVSDWLDQVDRDATNLPRRFYRSKKLP